MTTKKGSIFVFAFVLVFALLILSPTLAHAAPLVGVPITVTQPDGTVLNLFASGDEYYNWVSDANGYTVIQNHETGYYVYADLVNGELVPTDFVVGQSDPAGAGLSPYLNISAEKKTELRQASVNQAESLGPVQYGPKTGTITNLVIFIRFSGESEFTDATSTYTAMLNSSTSGANSLYNYYREVSYNALTINSNLYPTPGNTIVSYQDSHARGYFQPYDATTNPTGYATDTEKKHREDDMLKAAVDYVSSLNQFPAGSTIDADNDGKVDAVTFVISGTNTGWNTLLWPHKWQFYPDFDGYTVTINSKTVEVYNFQMQSMINTGVLAHEMFHVIGAPDLYHYTTQPVQPVGAWDVMEFNSNPPEHMGCYMKFKYGNWISSIPTLSSSGTQVVSPVGTSAANNCFRINSPNSTTEYFVVEYRRATGAFESSLPGSGLLVYRINTAADDGNAYGPPDEVYIYRPNGTLNANGSINTANFSSDVGRTQINDSTNPSSFLSNGNAGGLNISNVGAAGDTISFYATVGAPSIATLVSPIGTVGEKSPTYRWNAVSSSSWYYLWINGPSGNLFKRWYTAEQAGCAAGTGTCSITPSLTLTNGAHRWWIQTWNANGYGPWSAATDFTVNLRPPAATLVSPTGTISTMVPTFTWNAESKSTWYYLWIDGPSGNLFKQWYTATQVGCAGGTGTCSVTPSISLRNGAYTWWIQTWNSDGYGPWSSAMNFTVYAGDPPAAATLVGPTGTITTNLPTYTWNAVSNSSWYYLWVKGPSGVVLKKWYTAAQAGCGGGTGTCSIKPSYNLGNGSHTWWVQTWNNYADGPWSSPAYFTVNNTVGFNSQFNDNASGWQTHLGTWSIDSANWFTVNGIYGAFTSASYAADFSNFQYEVTLLRNGCQYCANSLWIRGTPNPLQSSRGYEWNSGYLFEYTRDGLYSVWRIDPGNATPLVDDYYAWWYSSAINQDSAWNTLRVVANGGYLAFYINGSLVWYGYDYVYPLGRPGITMFSDGTSGDRLWADYAVLNVGSYYIDTNINTAQEKQNLTTTPTGVQCLDITKHCNVTVVETPMPK